MLSFSSSTLTHKSTQPESLSPHSSYIIMLLCISTDHMHLRKVFVSNIKLIKILPRDSHQGKRSLSSKTWLRLHTKSLKNKNKTKQHCKSIILKL